MKKASAFIIIFMLVLSLASCKMNQRDDILEAWTGDYSEEKFKEAIAEYKTNYNAIVSDDHTEISSVSFQTDFEISSCTVQRVSLVDDNDVDAELQGSIYLYVETSFDDHEVTVSTDWWYNEDDWTKNYAIWSYLVCVIDSDGAAHYYYFRTDYSPAKAEE